MRQYQKRLTALLLAALLTIGLVPTASAAVEPTGGSGILDDAAWNEIKTEETISIEQADVGMQTQSTGTAELALDGYEFYSEAYDVLALVNSERKANGLSTLSMDEELMDAAMQRAAEGMVYFSHERPNGNLYYTLLQENGIQATKSGENIAYGYPSASEVMNGWMNSQGHRANILSKESKAIGIGCFVQENGTVIWVQLFTDRYNKAATRLEDRAVTRYVKAQPELLGKMTLTLSKSTLDFEKSGTATAQLANTTDAQIPAYLAPSCLTFFSSNTSVATVSASGKVTAKSKAGTATISAVLRDAPSIKASKTVTVKNQFDQYKPTGVSVSNQSAGIKVKWNALSGADSYMVYRSAGSGSYKKVGTTSKTSWTDKSTKNGTKYRYKIYASRGGVKSAASSSKTMYRLTAIKITSATSPSAGRILLRWTKNTGGTGYYVERTDNKTGDVEYFYTASASTTAAYINNCTSGRQYTVRMYAYKKVGTKTYEGVKSAKKTVTVK